MFDSKQISQWYFIHVTENMDKISLSHLYFTCHKSISILVWKWNVKKFNFVYELCNQVLDIEIFSQVINNEYVGQNFWCFLQTFQLMRERYFLYFLYRPTKSKLFLQIEGPWNLYDQSQVYQYYCLYLSMNVGYQ